MVIGHVVCPQHSRPYVEALKIQIKQIFPNLLSSSRFQSISDESSHIYGARIHPREYLQCPWAQFQSPRQMNRLPGFCNSKNSQFWAKNHKFQNYTNLATQSSKANSNSMHPASLISAQIVLWLHISNECHHQSFENTQTLASLGNIIDSSIWSFDIQADYGTVTLWLRPPLDSPDIQFLSI